MPIHETAIINPRAEIDPAAEIGPYVVIEGKATIGAGTRVMAHAYISGTTTIGPDNIVHPFAVLGHAPQDLSYRGEDTCLQIGRGNTFREGCSIHRGTKPGSGTVVGDNNFLMGNSHIGHDSIVGNEVIIANGALISGHVNIEDKAFISGNTTVHQFVNIGTQTMIGGLSRVTKDVPPYMLLEGSSTIRGINVVGLRRSGFDGEQRARIKRIYKLLYHSGLNTTQALEAIEGEDLGDEAKTIVEFIRKSNRGICKHA